MFGSKNAEHNFIRSRKSELTEIWSRRSNYNVSKEFKIVSEMARKDILIVDSPNDSSRGTFYHYLVLQKATPGHPEEKQAFRIQKWSARECKLLSHRYQRDELCSQAIYVWFYYFKFWLQRTILHLQQRLKNWSLQKLLPPRHWFNKLKTYRVKYLNQSCQ